MKQTTLEPGDSVLFDFHGEQILGTVMESQGVTNTKVSAPGFAGMCNVPNNELTYLSTWAELWWLIKKFVRRS